jgi:hypothetical protein
VSGSSSGRKVKGSSSISPPKQEEAKDTRIAPRETVAVTSSAANGKGAHNLSDNMTPTSIVEFSQDINDQEAPVPLPPDTYPGTCIKAETVDSKATPGNTLLHTQWRIEPDAYPADFTEGNPDGETLSYYRVIKPETAQRRFALKQLLLAVGITPSRSLDPNEFIGLSGQLKISNETYEGVKRAKIDSIV